MTNDDTNENWAEEWLEDVGAPQGGGSGGRDEFLQVEIGLGVVVTPKSEGNRRWKIFPANSKDRKDEAVEEAKAYLASLGEETVRLGRGVALRDVNFRVPGIYFTKYPATHLGVDVSGWKSTNPWQDIIYLESVRNDDGKWVTSPNWTMVFESLVKKDDEGTNVAPFADFEFGDTVWAHMQLRKDLTFDYEKPETWGAWNSTTKEIDGEERTFPKDRTVLVKAFKTQAELIAYMNENGYEIVEQGSTGAKKDGHLPDVTFPEDWAKDNNITKGDWDNSFKAEVMESVRLAVDASKAVTHPKKKKDMLDSALQKISSDWTGLPKTVLEEMVDSVLGLAF